MDRYRNRNAGKVESWTRYRKGIYNSRKRDDAYVLV